MTRGHRPSIGHVGTLRDDGHTVTISGWQLGLCATRCTCHRDPDDGHLAVHEDQTMARTSRPVLGLISHRPCDCCSPWTADELAAIVRDIADITALMAQT